MRKVWCLFLTLFTPQIFASPSAFTNLLACEKSPQACIVYTEAELGKTEVYSRTWYHLKNLSLAAQWQLIQMESLRKEIPTLANLTDAPAVFRVTVLTIYSKLALADSDEALGRKLVEEVTQLIKEVNAVSLNPDRYAELIILLNSVKDYGQAERVGKQLLTSFERSRRSIELGDFYTALGHTQYGQSKYPQARRYYQLALQSFIDMQHSLEISNTLHNIARSYQAMAQYDLAIPQFEQALQWKREAGENADPRNEQYTRMRYVESLFHAGQRNKAQSEFEKIDQRHVLGSYLTLYSEIADLIGR